MTTTKKPKEIHSTETYDRNECTSTGYDVSIRDDGTARLVHRSCWQGSRDGDTYIAPVPGEVMRAVRGENGDDEPDAETAILNWLSSCDHEEWRRIRTGWIVR